MHSWDTAGTWLGHGWDTAGHCHPSLLHASRLPPDPQSPVLPPQFPPAHPGALGLSHHPGALSPGKEQADLGILGVEARPGSLPQVPSGRLTARVAQVRKGIVRQLVRGPR